MATIHDVAREAGVSISTVSYALSGKRSIAEPTRQRVLAAAARLRYLPNAGARMLAGTETRILALTAPMRPTTSAPAHMAFVLAVTAAARRFGYDILLLTEAEGEGGLERVAVSRLADGIVVLDVALKDERVELARTLDTPSVVIGVPGDPSGLMCVDLDFAAGVDLAIERLAAAGHRRVALVGHGADDYARGANFPVRVRDAFLAAVADGRIEGELLVPKRGGAAAAVDAALAGEGPPTALLLHAEESAQAAALDAVAARGLRIPEDIAVVSVGSSFDAGALPVPVDQVPLRAEPSCDRAIELLVAAIGGQRREGVELVRPTYEARGSVEADPAA